MADVTGPISSLPGSIHLAPTGMMCDTHSDIPAVHRVQGETDSFGCEMYDMCQGCYDEWKEEVKAAAEQLNTCEWCKTPDVKTRPRRDYEEGTHGRVYDVCNTCIDKENKRLAEEMEDDDYNDDYFGDDYD